MANWYNNLLHITTQVHSSSSLATKLINLDTRDIMSKYDLPQKQILKYNAFVFCGYGTLLVTLRGLTVLEHTVVRAYLIHDC
jgi:hypothetical protein